jgi:nicotinate-nucleotide adenylyltransferase
MNIGICGGTFDPIHRGHLDSILAVRERMQWDRVLYIPAFVQPFKQNCSAASPYHRFAMTVIATLEHEFAFASPIELERGRVSYTVDTLEELRRESPNDTIDWIIGDDNLAKLHEWKSIDRIFELANFAVLARSGREVPESLAPRAFEPQSRPAHGAIVFTENPLIPISSTAIRERLFAGEAIDELVPPPVSRYIQHYGLYRKANRERLD